MTEVITNPENTFQNYPDADPVMGITDNQRLQQIAANLGYSGDLIGLTNNQLLRVIVNSVGNVDDVLEFLNFAALPVTGESGKLYITTSDDKSWRWNGSTYVDITGGLSAIPAMTMLGNNTAGSAVPTALSRTSVIDMLLSWVRDWVFPGTITATDVSATEKIRVYDPIGGQFSYLRAAAWPLSGVTIHKEGDGVLAKLEGSNNNFSRLVLTETGSVGKATITTNHYSTTLYGGTSTWSELNFYRREGGSGDGFYISQYNTVVPTGGTTTLGEDASGFRWPSIYATVIGGAHRDRDFYELSGVPPANGETHDVYFSNITIINTATNLASLTLRLLGNAGPAPGQTVGLKFMHRIDALTITGVLGTIATISVRAGQIIRFCADYTGVWHVVDEYCGFGAHSQSIDASGGGTITPAATVRTLKLTGAAPAALTINAQELPDGDTLTVFSVNGVTALTVGGGTNLGTLTTLPAAGVGTIRRCGTELITS